jgi:hypothetical protein
LALICSRTSGLISPVSPDNIHRKKERIYQFRMCVFCVCVYIYMDRYVGWPITEPKKIELKKEEQQIPVKRARNPWARELITSISWRVIVWTTSFLFCSSPLGQSIILIFEKEIISLFETENKTILSNQREWEWEWEWEWAWSETTNAIKFNAFCMCVVCVYIYIYVGWHHVVIVLRVSCKGTAQFCYFSCCFIQRDNISYHCHHI